MSSFKPFPLATATLFAAALVASTACSSSTPDTRAPGGSSSNLEGSAGADVCSGKACGVDCTPSGSDEPFNCNASGQCVSAGNDLGCKCPEFVGDCTAGTAPADRDGDGCVDGCAPVSRECSGKACGVDCTPAGSDEPFNCNATGQCVATGNDLGCAGPSPECGGKACGVDCTPPGGDEPFSCNAQGRCVYAGDDLGCAP